MDRYRLIERIDRKLLVIIEDIITQHAEEAAFLWLLRDYAVSEPDYTLEDLCHLDERVEAHLDGLRIAGEPGWEICKEALAMEEPGEVFAAAVLAYESGDAERIALVLDLVDKDMELSNALISALGWIAYPKIEKTIDDLVGSKNPNYRCLGIAADTIHGIDAGEALRRAINAEDEAVKRQAIRAAGELGLYDTLLLIQKSLLSEEQETRFIAAWSTIMLGDRSAVEVLIPLIDSSYQQEALNVVLRCLPIEQAKKILYSLSDQQQGDRLITWGAGIIGDPAFIPELIVKMQEPALARVAGEAFSMITGIDMEYENLEGEWPEGFEAGPTENPEDENVEMDPDEDLAWPNQALIQAWWDDNGNKFTPGTRYLYGLPINKDNCIQVLNKAYQRQRAGAAIELALMDKSTPLFNVGACGFWQREWLGGSG